MPISEFKATCLAVLERVRQTGEPDLVTKRGMPVAQVVPASHMAAGKRELGTASGANWYIVGDLLDESLTTDSEWEALSD